MMVQWCRLHRRANAWTIKAVTVERCVSLSTFCAGAQTLPLTWRGSATLLEKAEGLLCHWHIWSVNSARPSPRYGTMLGSHPHRKIGKNRLRVGCVDKLNSRDRLHQSPVFPRVLAFIVIGSGVSLAISGRSSSSHWPF